jgi:hypothetical protein
MQFDYVEKRIGAHFLALLINGDASGLSDAEIDSLTDWQLQISCARVPSSSHWAVVENSREEFARCDVSGLMGACESVRYYFPLT